jgi:hypothetical protein
MERFWEKVDASGDCWEWVGAKIRTGYGHFGYAGRVQLAHRVVWQLLVGEIPDGLQMDHLCRNRACVNPDHLQPVTASENQIRGGSKRRSLYCGVCGSFKEHTRPNGYRSCRPCAAARRTRWRRARGAQERKFKSRSVAKS